MNKDIAYTNTEAVEVNVLAHDSLDAAATMKLPAGTVVKVDTFDGADRSAGIFEPLIVLEIVDRTGRGTGIFVEILDTELAPFAFVPYA